MQAIKNQIEQILKAKGIDQVQFNVPPKPEMGDFSSAVAIATAKRAGKNPMEIAQDLQTELKSKIKFIKDITISAPGYLNFFVDYSSFANVLLSEIIEQETIFAKFTKKGATVSVEHTGVNPNKAMHIGHIRNSIIGDVIANLHNKLGYPTVTINYIDDTGIQVADIVTALLYFEEPIYAGGSDFTDIWDKWDIGDQSFDYFCWDLYASLSQSIEDGNELLAKKRKEVFTLIEKGNNSVAYFAKEVSSKIVNAHIQTLKNLDISFNLMVWESDILAHKLWDRTFELLKEKGLLVKEDQGPNVGCWVVKAGGVTKVEDQEYSKDKILVKSDGTLTYTAKDLAYELWKLGKLSVDFEFDEWDDTAIVTTTPQGKSIPGFGKADEVINVIDYRQAYPQQIIKDVLKQLDYLPNDSIYQHLAYGVVNLTDKAAEKIGVLQGKSSISMSGRKGIGVKADDLIKVTIDELDKKANNITTSRKLAISAIKFYMTKFASDQNINFDFDAALQTTGESGIYLSYTYARAINVLEKAGYKKAMNIAVANPTDPEKNLVKQIADCESVLTSALENLEPAEITRYAYQLCSAFAEFYEQKNVDPIYKEKNDELRVYRLALVKSFSVILKDLFSILGIEALEKI